MLAVAFGVLWAAYGVGLYGWTQIRGYVDDSGNRIKFSALIRPPGYSGPWGSIIGMQGGDFGPGAPRNAPSPPGGSWEAPPLAGGGGGPPPKV